MADLPTSTPAPPTATPKPAVPIADLVEQVLALTGDPARGEKLFRGSELLADGKVAGCSGCHSVDGTVGTGPSLKGAEADMPSSYKDFDTYVIESIVDPAKFKVAGFENVNMPVTFFQRLSTQDLADILAYIKSVQ